MRQTAIICAMQVLYRLYLSASKRYFAARHWLRNPAAYAVFKKLEASKTYAEYKQHAQKLDELDPAMQKWREENSSLYNINTINSRIEKFETRPTNENDMYELMFELRTGLLRKHFGIGCAKLYRGYTSSSKKIIERYIRSVLKALNHCTRSPDISAVEKLAFLRDTRRSFGRTALCLSGGLSLGAFHFGVIKGLFEADCLPNIVSGASAGSIICGWLAVQTDAELGKWCQNPFDDEVFTLLKFHKPSRGETELETRTRKIYEGEGIFDLSAIKDITFRFCGNMTLLEAYVLTGRVTNIVVSSESGIPFLLNYLTTPHIYIWSAVCASVAVPGVFKAVELKAKNRAGLEVPYDRTGARWMDGSFTSDLPYQRLSELFNVNHFIVSQVSPHRTFFGPIPEASGFFGKTFGLLTDQTRAAICSVETLIPHRFTWLALLRQKGVGDITIYPTDSIRKTTLSVFKLLENPNVQEYMRESERQVWRQSTRIRLSCVVEILMDHLIDQIEQGTLDMNVVSPTGMEKKIYGFAGMDDETPAVSKREASAMDLEMGILSRREFSSGRLFSVTSLPNFQHQLEKVRQSVQSSLQLNAPDFFGLSKSESKMTPPTKVSAGDDIDETH